MASSLVGRERTDAPLRAPPPSASGTAIICAITVVALYVGREVFVPVALAILLSFVLAPLVLLLRRARLGRVPSVLVAVLVAIAVIFGIGALIGGQLAQIAEHLPEYQFTIEQKIQSLQSATTGSGIVARTSAVLDDLRREIAKADRFIDAQ